MVQKKFFLLSLLLLTSTLKALTLSEALEEAINLDPLIKEKVKRSEEIYYDKKIALSGYFPKVDLLSVSSLDDSSKLVLNETNYDVSIMLNQNIFNGFSDSNKNSIELAKYKSSLFTVKELTNSFSLEVITAYLNLLKEREMLNVQLSSVENHENILEKIVKKYDAGLGNQLELRLSQTSLYLAKINYINQKNIYRQRNISLERYLNREVDIDVLVTPDENIFVPHSYEEAFKIALASHPSMHVAQLNKELSDYELAYSKRGFFPSFDLRANYYTGEDGRYRNFEEYYEVYLQLSYNIFNGGADYYEQEKYKKKVAQKDHLIEKVKRDIVNRLKRKYDEYLMLKKRSMLLDQYVQSKELTLESYYSQFSIGKANLQDILDTTESLYSAKRIQLDGKFDLLIAAYAVLEAMGQLPKITMHSPIADRKALSIKDILDSSKERKKRCFIVTASKLNVRKDMSASSAIIGSYVRNDEVCSDRVEDIWVRTKRGWISKTYLKESDKI